MVGHLHIAPRAREGSRKSVKEEFMKSLSELADVYEKWATANEARADEILAAQDSLRLRNPRPSALACGTTEGRSSALKKRAAELRKLEERRSMYCVDPTVASGKARS